MLSNSIPTQLTPSVSAYTVSTQSLEPNTTDAQLAAELALLSAITAEYSVEVQLKYAKSESKINETSETTLDAFLKALEMAKDLTTESGKELRSEIQYRIGCIYIKRTDLRPIPSLKEIYALRAKATALFATASDAGHIEATCEFADMIADNTAWGKEPRCKFARVVNEYPALALYRMAAEKGSIHAYSRILRDLDHIVLKKEVREILAENHAALVEKMYDAWDRHVAWDGNGPFPPKTEPKHQLHPEVFTIENWTTGTLV